MIFWKDYEGHEPITKGKRNKYDDNIYTFDIETTSYIILNGELHNTIDYLDFTQDEKENSLFYSTMYIWMFGINDKIYYGRTYQELFDFLTRLEYYTTYYKKIVYVHNLSFEFQFLRNIFHFKDVMARKSRKVMKCEIEEFNIEFRCSLYMTNSKLEKLPELYQLSVKKLVGNLDYSKIRHSQTKLTKKELEYCENDCLVVYEYIKKEIEEYETTKNIPITSTGHVRRELKEIVMKDWEYRNKTSKSINTDGHVYNLLIDCFMGGYTHANWIYTDEIVKNVTSYDFTSSYPYVMTTHKFPMSEFRKCNVKNINQIVNSFAYIFYVKFKNIKCKYFNNFISQSNCKRIKNARYDNGRIISADEIEIVLTDVDFKFILSTYTGTYEIIESYFARYDYLPIQFINFILEKYKLKTQYKNVKGKEVEYSIEKAKFNSLYGMSVTNNIKDTVIFDNELGWNEIPINNEEILKQLGKEKKQGFLSFSWGVWITAWARYNLLSNLIQMDKFVVYSDTDSLKLKEGFDINIIEEYNKKVNKKIDEVSEHLQIEREKFEPKDIKGIKRTLGIFDKDGEYSQFITQGAKKYAYIDKEDYKIHITVSGVPKKKGAKGLKKLEDFKDNFVFEYKDTNKLLISYSDDMENYELTDYKGKKYIVSDKYGACFLPCQYTLNKSEEYINLLNEESSKRAVFKEG